MFVFYSLIKELESRNLVVTGVPEAPQEAASVSGATTDSSTGPDSGEVASDGGSESSGETFQL